MVNNKKIYGIVALSLIAFNTVWATWTQLPVNTVSSTWVTSTWIVSTWSVNTWVTSTLKVEWIDFLDSKTLSVKLSNQIDGISKDSEVKILEDLSVATSQKDLDNAKKIKVTLNSDLVDWSSYSLVSVSEGLDTSIDFSLTWDKSKILNSNFVKEETSIEYISVLDNKTIEIFFNKDVKNTTVEFKMFKELKVESNFLDTTNLNVKMFDKLQSKKDYIAILSLKDNNLKDIEIVNSLYDFTTPEFPEEKIETLPVLDNTWTTLSWTTATWVAVTDAAMNVTQTPDTWAKTNILILMTFLLTLGLYLSRNKIVKS